jgi:nucleoid-associated protein YgaU
MILGAIVIVVVGVLIINYFGGREEGTTIPPIDIEDSQSLPSTHTVQAGEDLWKISEIYYETGYNWVDIAEANDLTSPNQIEEGQELIIPDIEARVAQAEEEPEVETTENEVEEVVGEDKTAETFTEEVDVTRREDPISGASYTVVKGDTLWDIAIRAYGDGYRWVDIAQENELANPDLIHPGNVFVLPR